MARYAPDPHTGEASDTHECEKNHARLRSRHTEHASNQDPIDIRLAERSRDSEAANQEHYRWREHHREYPSGVDR